jgi:transcriptional regulator with XRE-family HTH domain
MPVETLAKYLNEKRLQEGLTYEGVATVSNIPEATIKNLFTGKTKNPGWETLLPVMDAVGGSFDEMLHPEKPKDEMKETSVLALKDIYEYQLSALKETNEAHIHNIRSHYEQHHEDLKENYERRLSDKRELIESYKEHIQTLEKECRTSKISFWICVAVFIAVLIAEVMNPNLGWFRF